VPGQSKVSKRRGNILTIGLSVIVIAGISILLYSLGWLSISITKETYGSAGEGPFKQLSVYNAISSFDTGPNEIVKIKGTISSECQIGTWFKLKDENEEIFVDLKAVNIALPDRIGKTATVYGILKRRGLRCYLDGMQVEF